MSVALTMIFQHFDKDMRSLEKVAQKRFGEARLVEFLKQHHEQIPVLHYVEQVVLQNCARK